MKNPAGVECRYFYGNYFRGRNEEECLLIGNVPPPNHWTPEICSKCPIPGILRANSCENMRFEAKVERRFFGIHKSVNISAYCTKSKKIVDKPEVGCGICHPLPEIFITK